MVNIIKERRDFITPYRFGAKGGAEYYSNFVCVNGNATVNNTTDAPFTPASVGQLIYIQGGLANGGTLATTILTYVSASQITVVSAPTSSGTKRGLIGYDDTDAIKAAIVYARKRAKAVILDGQFITTPLKLSSRTGLVGLSRGASGLLLKPGSATADKFLIRNNASTDYNIVVEDLRLDGLKDFQRSGAGALLTDINVLEHAGSGATELGDVYNVYRNLLIQNANRAAVKYAGKGGSLFDDIVVLAATYGLDLNSPDNIVKGMQVTATGAGFYLGALTVGCKFLSSRASKSGYAPQVDATPGVLEQAGWSLTSSSNNEFVECEAREGWSSLFALSGASRNSFTACRAADAGCLYSDGLGSNNTGEIRAAWRLMGASLDNRFAACTAGVMSHGNTSYASHAVLVEGTSANNVGNIITDKNASAWATAKIGRSSSGVNLLMVDDEPVELNDDSYLPNRHFYGDFV